MAEKSLSKTFRDAIHGDIEVFPHELIVINTRTYQRLHGIRQLDLAHKVYQDAVHTRFEHLIGATYLADRIWRRLSARAHMKTWATDFCPRYEDELSQLRDDARTARFQAIRLPDEPLEITRHVVRLATLLHDVTHIPFGHMLENQLALFTAHDSGHRLLRFTGSIIRDVSERFTQLRQEADPYYAPQNVYYLLYLLTHAARILAELSKFSDVGLSADNEQRKTKAPTSKFELPQGLPSEFYWTTQNIENAKALEPSQKFLADIIGNTICADLLDYVRRDNYFTGLWDKYDDRIFEGFSLARIKTREDHSEREEVRLAVQVIKGKLRSDTISNILRILELRYDLAEKVIFHHARCSASAMLARAFCLSGLGPADEALFYDLGDDEAISCVEKVALDRQGKGGVDKEAVDRLLNAMRGRDFYKPYYRFLRGANEATRSGDVDEPTVGEKLFAGFTRLALPLISQVEQAATLPHGSVVLYCPDPKMMLKETASIVCGEPEAGIPRGQTLKEFVQTRARVRFHQIEALEDRYGELWGATFYVHPEFRGRSRLLKEITMRLLEEQFKVAPTSDPILDAELAKLPTAQGMADRIAAIQEIDLEVLGGMAGAQAAARSQEPLGKEAVKEEVRTRISEVIRNRAPQEAKPVDAKRSKPPGVHQPKSKPGVAKPDQLDLGRVDPSEAADE